MTTIFLFILTIAAALGAILLTVFGEHLWILFVVIFVCTALSKVE